MAALGGIERRDPDEPVHADLALEISVGVLSGDLDGDGLDARLFPRQEIEHLGLETGPLRPAQVHAHEVLGPVLRLRAARPRMDREDGVFLVLGSGQDDLDGEALEIVHERGEPLLDLRSLALIARFRGHLPEDTEVFRLLGELLEAAGRAGHLGALLDEGLCPAAVIPEGGRRHLLVDQGEPRLLGGKVKDAPGGPGAASPRRRDRA